MLIPGGMEIPGGSLIPAGMAVAAGGEVTPPAGGIMLADDAPGGGIETSGCPGGILKPGVISRFKIQDSGFKIQDSRFGEIVTLSWWHFESRRHGNTRRWRRRNWTICGSCEMRDG